MPLNNSKEIKYQDRRIELIPRKAIEEYFSKKRAVDKAKECLNGETEKSQCTIQVKSEKQKVETITYYDKTFDEIMQCLEDSQQDKEACKKKLPSQS